MGLFEWYFGLRPLHRFFCSLVPLALSTIIFLNGRFWPWGWVVGAIMFLASFPTRSEKSEWGDW